MGAAEDPEHLDGGAETPAAKPSAKRKKKSSQPNEEEGGRSSLSHEQLFMQFLNQKFGDANDSGTDAQSRVDNLRIKEAEHIKVGSFPNIGTVREWVVEIRKAVMSASGRPTMALQWM